MAVCQISALHCVRKLLTDATMTYWRPVRVVATVF